VGNDTSAESILNRIVARNNSSINGRCTTDNFIETDLSYDGRVIINPEWARIVALQV